MITKTGFASASIGAFSSSASYRVKFVGDLPGSDELRLGDEAIKVNAERVCRNIKVVPGSDYRLYLTPKYVENRPGFSTIEEQSL